MEELSPNLLFHSFNHTKEVLSDAEKIGKEMGLGEEDLNVLRLSAIFHDTGYTKTYDGHEEESAKIARQYLEKRYIEEKQIEVVERAILSTKVPQNPEDLVSQILCDADLANLTYENYFESAEKLRLEWLKMGIANLSKKEFHKNSAVFFEIHHYHSEFAIKHWKPLKKKNLILLKEAIARL